MIDIVIIGSGAAGLSAALEAKSLDKNVLVVSKTMPTQSQTSQAQGGINAVLSKENSQDTIESHIQDTLKSAHKIGDEETIRFMCENAPKTIAWLDELGVPFSRDELNGIAQRKLGGTSHTRACYSSDYTGLKILHSLYDNCLKFGIKFLHENMVLNFIVENGIVKGITLLDLKTSQVKQILAKSIIIASGGYGAIYEGHTTNSNSSTGDAIVAALKAGCQLANMEFIQFHPTAMEKNCVLLSESARGEGGYLVNDEGERFVDELSSRDIVARAILAQKENGKKVYLDLRHLGVAKIQAVMPQEYELALTFGGVKLDKELIEIKPAVHYTMGGIKTNKEGKTNLENLFAVGEVACNGVHGANRLGGNSLLEIVSFGKYVGKIASEQSEHIQENLIEEYPQYQEDTNFIENLFSSSIQTNFYPIKKELGDLMYRKVGLFREEKSLYQALDMVKKYCDKKESFSLMDKSRVYNTNLKELLEFLNTLQLCEVIIQSAIYRKESRGAHYRKEYPQEEKNFEKETIVQLQNNTIEIMENR